MEGCAEQEEKPWPKVLGATPIPEPTPNMKAILKRFYKLTEEKVPELSYDELNEIVKSAKRILGCGAKEVTEHILGLVDKTYELEDRVIYLEHQLQEQTGAVPETLPTPRPEGEEEYKL